MTALMMGISVSVLAAAATKADMKPSLTPCVFSKASLYFSRSSKMPDMSHSWKVVSMAAVFCESLSR